MVLVPKRLDLPERAAACERDARKVRKSSEAVRACAMRGRAPLGDGARAVDARNRRRLRVTGGIRVTTGPRSAGLGVRPGARIPRQWRVFGGHRPTWGSGHSSILKYLCFDS
jgi:hypothetical protein